MKLFFQLMEDEKEPSVKILNLTCDLRETVLRKGSWKGGAQSCWKAKFHGPLAGMEALQFSPSQTMGHHFDVVD